MVVKARQQEKIKAIGYIRQSDEREDKEDISEQTQLLKIQQFCEFNDWELVAVFKDIDYSGFRISFKKRPGFMEAMEYLKNTPEIQKFVAFNLSRITRRKKDFLAIKDIMGQLEVDICSTAEKLDFGSATGRMVANILADFNEYYSDNLSDITTDNKETNAIKGRWNGGPPPIGLKKQGDIFVEDGEKAIWVKTGFELAKQGYGPYRVAKYLLKKYGVDWDPRRVRYILTNPTYAAMQKWKGKLYPLKGGYHKLVEWEDFLYIQNTLFGKEKAWKGKDDRQLLSSILRCPVCGGKMHSRWTLSKKTRRYMCSRKNLPGGCSSPIVDLPTMNDVVISEIALMAKSRYQSDEILSKLDDDQNDSTKSIQKLRDEFSKLESAKQNVFDDYYLYNKRTEDEFNALIKRYETRQKEIERLLEKVPFPVKNKYGDFDDILNEVGNTILELSTQDQRKLIELLIDRIVPGTPTKLTFRWGEIKEIPVAKTKYSGAGVYFY